jgi:L,D-transpeptidase ErfK/SrfK
MIRLSFINVIIFVLGVTLSAAHATTFVLPIEGNLIGKLKTVEARTGETLTEVGRRFDIGHNEIIKANPRISPLHQLFGGTKVLIPEQYILPSAPREGIVINLAELRLYYYPKGQNVVVTEPVGIGREGWNTPIGVTKIIAKQIDPVWRPTPSVRTEAAKNGTPIPSIFPPGKHNPLGKYVLRLGWPTYLIHGTNRPEGVGARVSAGCIRMLPEDVEYLFNNVPIGTKVTVINQPIKVGNNGNNYYIEAHPFLKEQAKLDKSKYLKELLAKYPSNINLSDSKLSQIISQASGYPIRVG